MALPRSLESARNEKAREQLAQSLPAIKQRNLVEYSNLFGKETIDEDQRSAINRPNTQPPEDPETAADGERN
jgi:hypothetical protein